MPTTKPKFKKESKNEVKPIKAASAKSITIAELIVKVKNGANRQFVVEKLGEYV